MSSSETNRTILLELVPQMETFLTVSGMMMNVLKVPQSSRMLRCIAALVATKILREFSPTPHPQSSRIWCPWTLNHWKWREDDDNLRHAARKYASLDTHLLALLLILFQHEQYFTEFSSYSVQCLQFSATQHLTDKAQATHSHLPLYTEYLR